jgi:hypothetical protein
MVEPEENDQLLCYAFMVLNDRKPLLAFLPTGATPLTLPVDTARSGG